MTTTIKCYKSFDKDLKCRNFQYEVGKEYEEDKASVCKIGFHATTHTLQCLKYYKEKNSRYAIVELSGALDRSQEKYEGKIAATKIKIIREISFSDLMKEASENLEVGGHLYLQGTNITSLPEGLKVGGSLDLRGTKITSLPDGLEVGGSLDLRGTNITSLPDGLKVGGYLDLQGTNITEIPKHLKNKVIR